MTRPRRYTLVVALDGSEYAEIVLEHALDQAARHTSVDLHFVTVIEGDETVEQAKARLATLALQGMESLDVTDWHARLHVRIGPPAEEIAGLAGEVDADLLVIGYFGVHPPRARQFTADRVLALVDCPTLVVALGGHTVEAQEPCEACVAERAASDGERWFCAEHASPEALDLTTMLPSSSSSILGGPMW